MPGAVSRRSALAGALGAVLLGPPAGGAAALPCAVPGLTRLADDGWTHVRRPDFRAGPEAISALAADRLAPAETMYVTNGVRVMRSTDRGCTWVDVSPDPAHVEGVVESRIDLLRVSDSGVAFSDAGLKPEPSLVVVAGRNTLAGTISQPFVRVRRGLEWFDATQGLEQAGPPVDLRIAAFRGGCAWLLTRPPVVRDVEVGYRLWYTPDIGRQPWTERTPAGGLLDGARIATDPMSCDDVWAARGGEILVSHDQGRTFATAAVPGFPMDVLHVARSLRSPRGAFAREVSAFGATAPRWAVVREPGRGAIGIPVPDVVTAVADGGRDTFVAVTTASGVYGYNPATRDWADMTPEGAPPTGITALLTGARTADDRKGLVVWVAHTEDEILLRGARAFVNVPSGVRGEPPRIVPGRPSAAVLSLTPDRVDLALRPGERARVPFRFSVPGRVRPVDVDLLVDTTGSMQQAINGVRGGMAGIVNALARERLDLRVGLADFKDIGATDLQADPDQSYVYRRRVRMARPGAQLEEQLRALRQHGNGDDPEAQTIALVESATGRGIPGIVPANGEAGFRPNATRIVVLVSDNPFKQGPPYPSIAETVGTLVAEDVRMVGVSVLNGGADADGSLRDLRAVASGTGSLAPAGGLDCDGDGRADAAAGEPLVCEVSPAAAGLASIANAITRLVLAARLPSPAAVRVTGETGALRALDGRTDAVIDRRFPARLDVAATFGCDRDQVGRTFPMRVEGALSGARVATAGISVRCVAALPRRAAVAEDVAGVPPAEPRPAVAVAPQGPPPPAHQLPQAPVSNVNPQAHAQPNAGFAAQEQQQPMLAFAGERAAPDLAMTGLPRPAATAAWLLGAAALTAGAATGLRRRTRTRTAPATPTGGTR